MKDLRDPAGVAGVRKRGVYLAATWDNHRARCGVPSIAGKESLAGARLQSIDGFMREVKAEIVKGRVMAKEAIPEQYRMLRTIQLTLVGYHRVHS